MTTDNEYDFTEGEDLDSTLWGLNSEDTITAQMKGVAQRADELAKHLENAVKDRDYYTTDTLLKNFINNDVSPAGWISSFCTANEEELTMPESMVMIPGGDDQIKAYAAGRKYIWDLLLLSESCTKIQNLLMTLHYEPIYGYLSWVQTFSKGGYDTALYGEIDTDIDCFSWFLNRDVQTDFNKEASIAIYLNYSQSGRDGNPSMSEEEFKKQYFAMKLQEFQVDVKARGFAHCLECRSDGTFSIKADWDSKMRVIDNYTEILTRQKAFESNSEEYVEECKKFMSDVLIPNDKELTTKAALALNKSFKNLVSTASNFEQTNLDEHEKFHEGTKAPYCFMTNPDALNSVQPKYSFNPSKESPFAHGTSFQELYRSGAKALGEQYEQYRKKSGPYIIAG